VVGFFNQFTHEIQLTQRSSTPNFSNRKNIPSTSERQMPSVKDFQKKKKAAGTDKSGSRSSVSEREVFSVESSADSDTNVRQKRRRPGRDQEGVAMEKSSSSAENLRSEGGVKASVDPVQTEFSGIWEGGIEEKKSEGGSAESSDEFTVDLGNKDRDSSEKTDFVEPEYVAYESGEEKVRTWEVPPQEGNKRKKGSRSDSQKIHIEFPYSEVVRDKIPGVFNLAETVAEEWVNDGEFQSLPVGHPLAQAVVGFGFRKAKDVEKKLDEKGVLSLAKMSFELVKSKLKK